jgi:hypothetical protein
MLFFKKEERVKYVRGETLQHICFILQSCPSQDIFLKGGCLGFFIF